KGTIDASIENAAEILKNDKKEKAEHYTVVDLLLFFSPETFVKIIDGKILTYPMKGTIDASIENAAEILKNDKKEKAEHYTVVDLL
ncbi:chorismate-binding protein, partial [Chryseobacterium sp. CH1]|uniref:chorismate-binding protein n=1 Tax=Chryseobacterium sp. CH1 TaxID=713551 RepID=UPI001E582431